MTAADAREPRARSVVAVACALSLSVAAARCHEPPNPAPAPMPTSTAFATAASSSSYSTSATASVSASATSSSDGRPSSSAAAALGPPEGPTGWNDSRVADELAQSCDFVPKKAVGGAPPPAWDLPPDPFRCEAGFQVGQAPHPCKAGKRECQVPFAEACRTCSAACVTTCGSCGKGCTDAACRRACGQSAAGCLQGCYDSLRSKVADRCMRPLEKCLAPSKAHGGSP